MNHPIAFDEIPAAVPRGGFLTEKQCFSRIGWAYVAMYGISVLLPYLIIRVLWLMRSTLLGDSTFITALGLAVMYLVAAPAAVLLLRRIPAQAPPPGRLSVRGILACLLVGITLMVLGGYVGDGVMQGIDAVFGTHSQNALDTLQQESGPIIWTVLILIAAPFVEELLYRKMLLDRVRQFGEVPAVLLSGLLFGLSHGNFYQFFYAASFGLVLAYVYLRTGKLRFCVLLHFCFNIIGGVIFPALAQPSQWMPSFPGSGIAAAAISFLYTGALVLCIVGSLLLVVKYWRSIVLRGAECPLPQGYVRTIFGNSGMVTFLALMAVMFALDIIL